MNELGCFNINTSIDKNNRLKRLILDKKLKKKL
jgi:hypothetical protein